MPALFFYVPADPENSEEEYNDTQHCAQSANKCSNKCDGATIHTHDFQSNHDSANGCLFPRPHSREISEGDKHAERRKMRQATENADDNHVQKRCAHSFPKACAR